MPISKDRRVLVDGFSNNITNDLPVNACGEVLLSLSCCLSSTARLINLWQISADKSERVRKCKANAYELKPINRPKLFMKFEVWY